MKNKYHDKIIEYLLRHPGEYVKIEEMGIDICAVRGSNTRQTAFDRAWQDIVASGRAVLAGNEIKIVQ